MLNTLHFYCAIVLAYQNKVYFNIQPLTAVIVEDVECPEGLTAGELITHEVH